MAGEHVDVLIVGAGISGIGAGCRLTMECPQKTFAVLEARDAIGGTWDTFRFPGIRSDTDMFTLSYPFRPWSGSQMIVEGPTIRQYIRDTAREFGVDEKVRFHHRVRSAAWSSAESCWTVEVERPDTGETFEMTCGFLYSCTGYYTHDEGYLPEFPGRERFGKEIVHPQFWDEGTDLTGKRVIVIGSGATAVTTSPAMAEKAAHVTMLQRSPSYILSLPAKDPIAGVLGRLLPSSLAYPVLRWRNALLTIGLYAFARRRPDAAKRLLRKLIARRLPADFDVDKHFKPSYEPWDQRMCIVPDNDLFHAIADGRVSVVTDHIETFTENGVQLASGRHLEADMIVTATGLQMLPLGAVDVSVDGEDVELPETVVYRGMMMSGVPNMAFAFGYINQSWTLGADLTSEHVCRLLNHMERNGCQVVTPRRGQAAGDLPLVELRSGYILRAIDQFPRQASHDPWRRTQNWASNWRSMRKAPLDDPALEYARAAPAERVAA